VAVAIARITNPEAAITNPEAAIISQSKQLRAGLMPATTLMPCTIPVKMADHIRSEDSVAAGTAGDAAGTGTVSTEVATEVTTVEALVAMVTRATATPLISSPKPQETTSQRRKMTAKPLKTTRSS
jgi:hypothetical protein